MVSFEALPRVIEVSTSPEDREHVKRYFYQHAESFIIVSLPTLDGYNFKGVRFVGPFEDSIPLQRECLFVATIKDSVAVEAAIMGKKTVIFGKTWFSGCPNIYAWENCFDYKQFIKMPIDGNEVVLQYLLNFRRSYCVLGYQNISQELRSADYADDFFHKV